MTFAGLTCGTLGWVCYYDVQRATGYLATGGSTVADFGSFPQRLKSDRIYLPDVVVVSGGRSDLGLGDVEPKATNYFRAVKKQYPKARIFVLEPFWIDDTPPQEVIGLRDEVQRAARTVGVSWISTSGWLTESSIGPDKVNPSDAGQRVLASKLSPTLVKKLG